MFFLHRQPLFRLKAMKDTAFYMLPHLQASSLKMLSAKLFTCLTYTIYNDHNASKQAIQIDSDTVWDHKFVICERKKNENVKRKKCDMS